ncbi:tetratricopeptide repeat protein [Algoriphagus ratkowskyi]|uniref:histidine kinase n=1 Tax=Algoriphagus ratkowskyi TaxID=57028 RepID=A0A2W7SYU6_9BACT|nr:tetratricopeptide repeat protein [Algoriphagus ratkowskyi]PZX56012.1 tetratricopeptide repeat protein [Algoriphagus ratkowskyi]TXD77177.1 tetratricopeptide repeat protein [Algoriphagus ratkowskyi]
MTTYIQLLFLVSLSIPLGSESYAQSTKADSLFYITEKTNNDSVKVIHYLDLGLELFSSDINRAISYFDEAIRLGNKIHYKKGLADAYNAKGRAIAQQGDFLESIVNFQEALKYFHEINDRTGEANILSNLGSIYYMLGNSTKALELHFESLKISEELDNKLRIGTSFNNIGTVYLKNRSTINDALSFFKKSLEVFQSIQQELGIATAAMNIGEVYFLKLNYDSAIYFHEMALDLCDETIDATFPLTQLGEINSTLGNFQKAYDFHRRALAISERLDAKFELTQVLIGLAKTQKKRGNFNDAIISFERAKLLAKEIDAKDELVDVYLNLAETRALVGDFMAAYENEVNAKYVKEEIAKTSTARMIEQLQYEFELNKKEAEIALLQKDTELKNAAVFNQRILIFATLCGLFMFLVISISLYRNNLGKQKANKLLQRQKEEIHAQRENIESAYDQLKSTQSQLIQSEKMASMGELASGIAHEIQNPLNFVNNFSEVSRELIEEVEEERAKNQGARDEELVSEILSDLKENLSKINHHGKRAGDIVKGMLEHSRSTIGEKVATDLNALAESYLRLCYHGLRAKDKSFNVNFELNLDSNLPEVEIIPQDIGRVLMNLINNAFYACAERSQSTASEPMEGYRPLVTISTKNLGDRVQIAVKDNGSGIPDTIKGKIFQPFFTTKPTGKGTGLGLSLSYDIVKAHGGELKVESKEGIASEFRILLMI